MPPQTIATTEVPPRPARIRTASPPEADPAPSVSPPPPAAESVASSESPEPLPLADNMSDAEALAAEKKLSAMLGRPLRRDIEGPMTDEEFEEVALAALAEMIRNPSSRISHEQFWREIDEDRERRDREESASGDAD